jgi:hypothetical protein
VREGEQEDRGEPPPFWFVNGEHRVFVQLLVPVQNGGVPGSNEVLRLEYGFPALQLRQSL